MTTLTGWAATPATLDVATLYELHAPEIHDFLARTVHDDAVAEDLTQNTFIRLIERGETVRETEKVRPWLFTVAHNLAVTHVTRRRPADPIDAALAIASGEKGPEEEAAAADAARLVWDAARSLEPRQYAVLDLTVRRGFTVAEIAEVLEITPAHAAVVVHRAREALGQAIRLLVVVRQRRHCARLAELIPEGTEVLTPDLRATADRHMRRCENCKEVGAKLTDPAELFAALPLLPLPLALHHAPFLPVPAVPVHAAGSAAAAGHGGAGVIGNLQSLAQRALHLLGQPAVLAGVGAAIIAVVGVGVGLGMHGGSPATPKVAATHSPRSGTGGGEATVPPLTGGPGQLVADAHRASTAEQDNTVEPTPALTVPVDGPVDTSPPPPGPPPSAGPPPAPAPTPIFGIHQHVQQVALAGNAGVDVDVYDPRTSSTPVVASVTPPGGAPIPLIRSF